MHTQAFMSPPSSLNPMVFDSDTEPPGKVAGAPSFEELFNHYHSLVYGIGLKFTGNQEDAEDVTQEVFTKVWRSLRGFNYNSSLKTWIYRITLNTCIDHSRKPWKKYGQPNAGPEKALEQSEQDRLPSDEESAESKLLVKETVAQVRKAITGLRPHLKSVIVLKDLEGLSYNEISSVLGLSLGTISSRLNRARKSLQAALSVLAIEES
jgi:RNA polymerase sigma-70 factor, ECF subfamily